MKTTRSKRRMTAAEFEAVRPLLKISDERIMAARAVLVEDLTYQAVADQFGWTRQAVGDAVKVVWATLQRYHESQKAVASAGMELPEGWEQVTLIAPSYLIAKFRNEIAQVSTQPAKKSRGGKKNPERE
jgi:predicted DNA-binding protein YlxM (UPF0122 family)